MRNLDIREAVRELIESASSKVKFDQYIESLAQIPASELLLACMQALCREPKAALIRLYLAKLLLQLDCASFAIEQLEVLQKDSESQSLNQLIDQLNLIYGNQSVQQDATVLASLDFDIELLDNEKD